VSLQRISGKVVDRLNLQNGGFAAMTPYRRRRPGKAFAILSRIGKGVPRVAKWDRPELLKASPNLHAFARFAGWQGKHQHQPRRSGLFGYRHNVLCYYHISIDLDYLGVAAMFISRISSLSFALLLCCLCGCSPRKQAAELSVPQVLFVCEHGNVKSLMAASYFNAMAKERGLPVRAVSRGSAPDSNTVPAVIAQHLRMEGFDMGEFHPTAVSGSDVSSSQKVVTIGTALPAGTKTGDSHLEEWNDVPAASLDYDGASRSLKGHVKTLLDEMSRR
jgi:hypothetical protein